MDKNFYGKEKIAQLSKDEWEQICMKCGRCCLCKISDGENVVFTDYVCKFFDIEHGCCSCYDKRDEVAGDICRKVDLKLLEESPEDLPEDCPYRLLYDGKPLPDYHPLITGDPNSAIIAGKTVNTMNIRSIRELTEAQGSLIKKSKELGWTEGKTREEMDKLMDEYAPNIVAVYPVKHKTSSQS